LNRLFKSHARRNRVPEIFHFQEVDNYCEGGSYHILRDAAYPISPCLLNAYRQDSHLGLKKKRFDDAFNGTRALIENAIGLLKQRFRQLFHDMRKVSEFILSCCVLRNMVIGGEDTITFMDGEENNEEVERPEGDEEEITASNFSARQMKLCGQEKRERIANTSNTGSNVRSINSHLIAYF